MLHIFYFAFIHLLSFFLFFLVQDFFHTRFGVAAIRRLRSDKISRAALTDICNKVARISALSNLW